MNSYESLEASLHDVFWASEEGDGELPLLLDFLRQYPGPSLEVGCGSGRLLLPLLQDGYEVEGLEISADMLDLCRSHGEAQSVQPVLHHADMDAFTPTRRYASLLVPAFTLQLAADPAATLHRFATWLTPGGAIYLTTFLPFAELSGDLPEDEWYPDHETPLPDGSLAAVHTAHSLDPENRTLHRQHRYAVISADGEILNTHESEQTLRWFDLQELESLLRQAGFIIRRVIPDFDPEARLAKDTQIFTVHARLDTVA